MRSAIHLGAGVCLLALATVGVSAQGARGAAPTIALSEEDVIRRAHEYDVRVAVARARTREVRGSQAERALWPDPTLSFVRESVAASSDTFLLAQQELVLNGRRGLLRDAGRAAVTRSEADERTVLATVTADVRRAFDSLLLAQERERVWADAVDMFDQLVSVLRLREEVGEGSRYDRMRGARALADVRDGRDGAIAERARAQGTLAAALGPGVVSDELRAVPATTVVETLAALEALTDTALRQRGDVQALQLERDRLAFEHRAAQRLRVPTPSVGAGLKQTTTGNSRQTGYQVSFDLRVPIFNRGQLASSQVVAQADRVEAEVMALRRRIALDVSTAATALRLSVARLEDYRQSVAEAADPLVATARVAYEEGELGILELLDATEQAVEARLRLAALSSAARLAQIELDHVTGRER